MAFQKVLERELVIVALAGVYKMRKTRHLYVMKPAGYGERCGCSWDVSSMLIMSPTNHWPVLSTSLSSCITEVDITATA